jgi:VanZ family protein
MNPPALARHPAVPAVLLAVWGAGLFLVSSLPGNDVSLPPFPFADKIAHFVYFAAGGFLFAWLLRVFLPGPSRRLLAGTVIVFAAVGALDEIHQLFTPGRMGADPGDWLADVLGAAAGGGVFLMIYEFFTRRARQPAPAGN